MDAAAESAEFLARNTADCLPGGALRERLALGTPLRVKLGLDPTAPDIHLGHVVVLQKLREFQDLGHLVVLIVGDYTARVGDPSGRTSTRPQLTGAEIDANAQSYQEQAFSVLDPERVEVRRNSEWLNMPMEDLFALTRTATVAQLLERDDFARRYATHTPISVLELLYPMLQAYDSVAVESDVELGGTDQKFNLLLGRDVQRSYGVTEQVVITMPILPGLDGIKKMSKSLGNHIGVRDVPHEMYGKTLSLPDEAMASWFTLLLGMRVPEGVSPRDAKHDLAHALVSRFHGSAAADAAAQNFAQVVIGRQVPNDVPDHLVAAMDGAVHLPALLADAFGMSRSEARRLLSQGGVRLDGEVMSASLLDVEVKDLVGRVLQAGKRRFCRIANVNASG